MPKGFLVRRKDSDWFENKKESNNNNVEGGCGFLIKDLFSKPDQPDQGSAQEEVDSDAPGERFGIDLSLRKRTHLREEDDDRAKLRPGPIQRVDEEEEEDGGRKPDAYVSAATQLFYSRLCMLAAGGNPPPLISPLSAVAAAAAAARAAFVGTGEPCLDLSLKKETVNAEEVVGESRTVPKVKAGKKTRGSVLKKSKAARKLHFDEEKSSPVSGTIIRELGVGEEVPCVRKGDIDPAFNVVEITDEAKEELARIDNKIGDFICRLCKEMYDDAFGLAQHRCSMIVHVEYRCPECEKVFNCPANLASHRRWHKPRHGGSSSGNGNLPAATVGGKKRAVGFAKSVDSEPRRQQDVPKLRPASDPTPPRSNQALPYGIDRLLSTPQTPRSTSGSSASSSPLVAATVTPPLTHACPLCEDVFPSVPALAGHFSHAHSKRPVFPFQFGCPLSYGTHSMAFGEDPTSNLVGMRSPAMRGFELSPPLLRIPTSLLVTGYE